MTHKEIESAVLITSAEYLNLESPEFIGQTRPNNSGEYRMYWKSGFSCYYTVNII